MGAPVRFLAATRLVRHYSPWIPMVMVAASTGVIFLLQSREFGKGFSVVIWLTVAVASGLAGAWSASRALMALVFLLPALPYFRYDTWLGKGLPPVIAAGVLLGVALNAQSAWSGLLQDHRRPIATAVLTFCALLSVSCVLVLLQRSPVVITALGREELAGLFSTGWASLRPQNTLPIVRSGEFLLGPIAGLSFFSLLVRTRVGGAARLDAEELVAAFLLTSVLNFGVACGQVYLPGFPVASLYQLPAGLFHNPVGLAELMTLAAPVALAVSLGPHRIRWLRPLAIGTVVVIVLIFVPIQQRSAHLGVTTGTICFLVTAWVVITRQTGHGHRRLLAVSLVAGPLLLVGLLGAYLGTTQWQQSRAAITQAPASAAWLGIGLRGETNRMAFFMVQDRPLGGYGVGGFEAALPAYYARHRPPVRAYTHALLNHPLLNHPLHMLVDLGVLGLMVNAWMFGAFLAPGLRGTVSCALPHRRQKVDLTAAGCFSGACALLLLSIWTGEWVYDASISVVAFMLLAVAAATWKPADLERSAAVPLWLIVALPFVHVALFALAV